MLSEHIWTLVFGCLAVLSDRRGVKWNFPVICQVVDMDYIIFQFIHCFLEGSLAVRLSQWKQGSISVKERIAFLVYHIKMVVEWMHSHEKEFLQVFYYFLFKIWTLLHVELGFNFNLLALGRTLLFSLSEMACLTLKVSGHSTPIKSACKKKLRDWGLCGVPFPLASAFTMAICCSSTKSSWFVLTHLFYQVTKGASGPGK